VIILDTDIASAFAKVFAVELLVKKENFDLKNSIRYLRSKSLFRPNFVT